MLTVTLSSAERCGEVHPLEHRERASATAWLGSADDRALSPA